MVEYHSPENTRLDGVLAALADPTRRAIFTALRGGEQRVTDLAHPFDVSLNAISKHIKTLERAGLVQRRRAGREHFVIANPAPLEDAGRWFDAQRAFWNERLDRLEVLMRKEVHDE
ncbi:MAG: ArsR/SmtB family transcription factor [Parvularcula sp.]